MEIDEIKSLWAESNRRLEASTRLNTTLLAQWNLRKTDTALSWMAREIAFELIVNAIGVVLIGLFASAHLHEPRFLIPAAMLDCYAIALIVAGARQLAAVRSLDYDEPVVAIQKRLEQLRLLRVRTTLATLLFAPLMWVPLLIVGLRGIFGVDVYAAGTAWLAANLLFGIAVIPAAVFVARRYRRWFESSKQMRPLADAIAGRSLTTALDSLDAIRRFEAS